MSNKITPEDKPHLYQLLESAKDHLDEDDFDAFAESIMLIKLFIDYDHAAVSISESDEDGYDGEDELENTDGYEVGIQFFKDKGNGLVS